MFSVSARFHSIASGMSWLPLQGLVFIAGIEYTGCYILLYMTANHFFPSRTIDRKLYLNSMPTFELDNFQSSIFLEESISFIQTIDPVGEL